MGIRFYSNRDVALGQFLIENCFQLHATQNATTSSHFIEKREKNERENTMLDHTLSYVHRPGRIDVTVHRIGDSTTATTATEMVSGNNGSGPFHAPIYMHSFCKVKMKKSNLKMKLMCCIDSFFFFLYSLLIYFYCFIKL